MILGYSSNAFTKYSLLEAVDLIAGLGFKGIEIMCDRPHLYPPDLPDDELTRLRTVLESHGLKITNLNCFTLFAVGDTYLPSWIEPLKEMRRIRIEHTLSCLRLAERLGCSHISVPPGGPLNGSSRRDALKLFHEGLDAVVPLAEELGVKILVEPEPGLLLETGSQFKDFIKDVRCTAVGLNFDVGHFFCAGEDPAGVFEELFQWTGHVHLEDIHADRQHRHLIPGQGSIDFFGFFETMRKTGYRGDATLELYPYVDNPAQAGREGRQHILPAANAAGFEICYNNY